MFHKSVRTGLRAAGRLVAAHIVLDLVKVNHYNIYVMALRDRKYNVEEENPDASLHYRWLVLPELRSDPAKEEEEATTQDGRDL